MDSLEATQWAPRDPRRGSRGERSPLLPLEARPVEERKLRGFPGGPSLAKNLLVNAGDIDSIPGPGRSHRLQGNQPHTTTEHNY